MRVSLICDDYMLLYNYCCTDNWPLFRAEPLLHALLISFKDNKKRQIAEGGYRKFKLSFNTMYQRYVNIKNITDFELFRMEFLDFVEECFPQINNQVPDAPTAINRG